MNDKIIIAFDGPDNVGKSTQIKLLRKKLNTIPFLIFDVDAPIGSNAEEKLIYGYKHIENTLSAANLLPYSQIHDRIHFTEYAYSFFRKGHNINDILKIEENNKELKEHIFIITFIDEVENISSRDDGLSQFDKDNYSDIYTLIERFKDISEQSIFDNSIINIHEKDIETVHSIVMDALYNKFPQLKK